MPTRTTTLRSEAERLIATVRRDPLLAQSVYYVSTGIWPIVHLPSFMALTGRKRDTWLVQTFGAFVLRRRIRPVYLGDAAVELLLAAAIVTRRGAADQPDERARRLSRS